MNKPRYRPTELGTWYRTAYYTLDYGWIEVCRWNVWHQPSLFGDAPQGG